MSMIQSVATLLSRKAVFGSSPATRTKFIWGQLIGPKHCPYIKRWVIDLGLFSIRLHHWIKSDDLRFPHDHAWNFYSIVLSGYITDRADGVDTKRRRGSIVYFPADHRHSVVVDKPCWTLLLTGPTIRQWGYWTNGKFRKRNKYFYEHGHHDPCLQE